MEFIDLPVQKVVVKTLKRTVLSYNATDTTTELLNSVLSINWTCYDS